MSLFGGKKEPTLAEQNLRVEKMLRNFMESPEFKHSSTKSLVYAIEKEKVKFPIVKKEAQGENRSWEYILEGSIKYKERRDEEEEEFMDLLLLLAVYREIDEWKYDNKQRGPAVSPYFVSDFPFSTSTHVDEDDESQTTSRNPQKNKCSELKKMRV